MKKIVASLCLVGLGLTHGLNIGIAQRPWGNNQSSYDLSCDGAHGTVKYYVNGVPNGVSLNGSTIVISADAKPGTYTITITAVDDIGQTAQKTVSLTIVQGSSTSGYDNGAFGGQLGNLYGGANTFSGQGAGQGAGQGTGQGAGQGTGAQLPGQGSGTSGSQTPGQGSGTPSSQTPGSQNPNDSSRLNELISTFSSTTATTTTTTTYPNNRYPTPNLPTNPDPNLYNPTPATIASQQAPRTDASRNTITPDDVALKAASERHQNAIKAITNLLTIIDKGKANKDKAQNDIQTYTQAYNDAVAAQRNAQNDIIASETKSAQITSAINALTTNIGDLSNKINQANAQNDALGKQKTTIITTITAQEADKAKLLDQLNGLNQKVGDNVKALSDKNAECQGLQNTVNTKNNDLTNAQNEFANIDANRNNVQNDVNNKAGIVDDLRKKLQDAEKDLADAKIKLANLDARKLQLPALIAGLKQDLANAQNQAQTCQAAAAQIQATIDGLKTGNLANLAGQVNDLGIKISNSRTQVSQIDAQIAASQGPLEDLKAKLAQANQNLNFLKNQKVDSDTTLRNNYQRGNDANNRVAFAKQNLDAIVKRFQDESKIVSDANLNLERARAEEALARLGLEEMIAKYSDALPYAIVPNGNGTTNPGTPYGNNPSGSPLGPIRTDGNGAPGSFSVPSWTNYLSSAYGAGVNPAFPGSVTQLFPFNFLSGVSGNQEANTRVDNDYNLRIGGGQQGGFGGQGGLGGLSGQGSQGGFTGGCSRGATLTQRVAVGAVVTVRNDGFDIKGDDGQVYTIRIAPCTQLNANKANYKMEVGNKAIVKGYSSENKIFDGTLVTCLQ